MKSKVRTRVMFNPNNCNTTLARLHLKTHDHPEVRITCDIQPKQLEHHNGKVTPYTVVTITCNVRLKPLEHHNGTVTQYTEVIITGDF